MREIEALPSEKEPEYLLEDLEFHSSAKKKYGSSHQRKNSNGKGITAPMLVVPVMDEYLGGDGCHKPAITFKGKC